MGNRVFHPVYYVFFMSESEIIGLLCIELFDGTEQRLDPITRGYTSVTSRTSALNHCVFRPGIVWDPASMTSEDKNI